MVFKIIICSWRAYACMHRRHFTIRLWFTRHFCPLLLPRYMLFYHQCIRNGKPITTNTNFNIFLLTYLLFLFCLDFQIIETKERCCVTLSLKSVKSNFSSHGDIDRNSVNVGPVTWKLRWLGEDDLLKFVALVKALHAGAGPTSPLFIK